jgi:hypothetical protein
MAHHRLCAAAVVKVRVKGLQQHPKNSPAVQQALWVLDDGVAINQISRDRLGKPGVHQY